MNSPYMTEPVIRKEAAMCTQHDPDIWFPARSESHGIHLARQLCFMCPVSNQECLSFGKATKSDGIWGGVMLRRGKVIHTET